MTEKEAWQEVLVRLNYVSPHSTSQGLCNIISNIVDNVDLRRKMLASFKDFPRDPIDGAYKWPLNEVGYNQRKQFVTNRLQTLTSIELLRNTTLTPFAEWKANIKRGDIVEISSIGKRKVLAVFEEGISTIDPNLPNTSLYTWPWSRVVKAELPKAVPGTVYLSSGNDDYVYIGLKNGKVKAVKKSEFTWAIHDFNPENMSEYEIPNTR